MDFPVTEEGFTNILRMFGRARDEFDRIGMHDKAQECDDAIALAQEIAIVHSPETKG